MRDSLPLNALFIELAVALLTDGVGNYSKERELLVVLQ